MKKISFWFIKDLIIILGFIIACSGGHSGSHVDDNENNGDIGNENQYIIFKANIIPENDTIDVPCNTNIEITFTKEIKINNNWKVKCSSTDKSTEYTKESTEVSWNDNKLIISPSVDFARGKTIYVNLYDFRSTEDEVISGRTLSAFKIANVFSASITPNNGASEIPVNANITISFNREPKKDSSWNVIISDNVSGGSIEYTEESSEISWVDETLTIDPLSNFPLSSTVTINLSNFTATDSVGLSGTTTVTFFVSNDFTAFVDPNNMSKNISLDTNINVSFSKEPIKNNDWKVNVVDNITAISIDYSKNNTEATWDGIELVINPSGNFPIGSIITVTLSGFISIESDNLKGISIFSFLINTFTTSSGMEFKVVQEGTFLMGDVKDEGIYAREKPVHSVTLDTFYIAKYELTHEQWMTVRSWALVNGYDGIAEGLKGGWGDDASPCTEDNQPVTYIKWYDAIKWCNALSEMEGLTPCYYSDDNETVYKSGNIDITNTNFHIDANGYRLPTEAEWEYAAKGGNRSQNYTYSGSNTFIDVGYCYFFSEYHEVNDAAMNRSRPVGLFLPNELGIYDMTGNVMEWCWDWYSEDYYQHCIDHSIDNNPLGLEITSPIESDYRARRGGSWGNHDYNYLRTSFRYSSHPTWINLQVGVRLVSTP